jgi:hypothetical protein
MQRIIDFARQYASIASLYLSKDQKPEDQILEAIGALFGGYWGSRLPDVFESANNPHHRALAHSLATGTAISATAIEAAIAWSMFFREKAEAPCKAAANNVFTRS